MKRSKYLETLSWEHHNGLVAASRLQKGLEKNVSPDIMKDFILHAWENELSPHFWQEEEILVEPLREIKETTEVLKHMLEDHRIFRRLIDDINNEQNSDKKKIEAFAAKLNEHIRFEERQLFPAIENHLSQNSLEKIGRFLHQHHKPGSKEWEPEFWK
jgi:hemerythrin-like domain-containing protein